MTDTTRPPVARPSWFRHVTFHSLLAGLCPIIPVPFLDDRVLAGVRRKMVRDLAAERGVPLDPPPSPVNDVLAGTAGVRRGCLGTVAWIAFSLTVRLLGKLFRKVLILFAVKESVDTASRVFHEGYLLHLIFEWAPAWDGVEGRPALDHDRALALRAAMEATVAEVDPRPLEQALRRAFRGSRGLLRQGARLLTRAGARAGKGEAGAGAASSRTGERIPEAEERRLLGGLVDRLTAELWEQQGYLEALEERFRETLAAAGPAYAGGEPDRPPPC